MIKWHTEQQVSLLPPENPAVRFQIWQGKSRRPYQKPRELQKPQLHKGLLRERRSSHLKRSLLHLFSPFVLIPHDWGSNWIFSTAKKINKKNWNENSPSPSLVWRRSVWVCHDVTNITHKRNNKDFIQITVYRHWVYANLQWSLQGDLSDINWHVFL